MCPGGFQVVFLYTEMLENVAMMTILGHLWIKDETNYLSELLLRTADSSAHTEECLTFVFSSC